MRKTAALLTAIAVAAGISVASPALSPASALSPGVQFSAENLPTWQTDGVVYALATAANGRVVVGGTFNQLRPPTGGTGTAVNRSALAVLNAETGAPESCALNVAYSAGTPTVRSLVASPDGNTVYVGGNFTSINGVNVTRVAAINPVTCTVTPFRGPSVSATVYAMALSGSRLYLAGAFVSVGGQPRQKFAAVSTTSNSTVLPWTAQAGLIDRATTVTADGRALTVSPDGSRVVVGGEFDTINGQDSHSIAVVDAATGANVRNYPAPFIHRNSVTKSLYSDGTRFYGGNEGTGGGVFDGRFAINWSTLEQEWRDNCLGATQAVLEHNGTLYAASHAHDCTSIGAFQDGKRNYFTAQNAAAPANLLQWFPRGNDGIGEGIGPRALTIAAGRTTGKEYLWSGGEFTQINGANQQGLTRWGPDDTGNPPATGATAEALTNGAIQVRFRTVIDTDDSNLTYRVFRNGSTTPIYTTTATSFWWTRPQVTFVDTNVTPGTAYSYRVQVTDGRNTSALSGSSTATARATGSAYASRVIADGARIFWRYDETSGEWVQDKSAGATTTTANNGLYKFGAVGGAAGAIRGDTSTAATFDGVDDFVWEDQLKQAPTTYTMETWIKTDTTAGGKIIGFGTGRPRTDNLQASPSRTFDRHVYMENSGRLTFGVYTGSMTTVRSALPYNDNQWHHVVATQGPAGMRLYVDGLAVGSNSVTTAQNYAGVWHVGGDNLNSWPNRPTSNYFRGQIDETAVYNAPLSARQVLEHYDLGGASNVNAAPTDAYGASVYGDQPDLYWRLNEATGVANDWSYLGRNDGTVGSAATRAVGGKVSAGSAIRTTGSTDSLVVSPQSGSPDAFTTEAWVKTTTTTGGKILGFEAVPTGTGGSYDKQVYMTNSGRLIFGVYDGAAQTVISPNPYNDGQWHHVVASQDSSGMKLYVDGALLGTNPATRNQVFSGHWRVGGGSTTSWPSSPSTPFFSGDIDEVAVYPRGLSAAEVAEHHTLGNGTAPADSQAPSVPGSPSASVDGSTATVRWTASTDNVGVSAYRVYRGTSADFAVGAASLVGTVSGTTYTGAGLAPGTYYYRVVAVDAAGNASAASAAVSATVSGGTTTPVVVTGGLTADALVAENNAAKAYGTVNYLVSRGGTGAANISYLSFDVPAAPAGRTLTGATLRIRTSTDSAAGSADSFALRLVSDPWNESTVTWTTRPTALGATVGTLTGARSINTSYDVTLDAAALAALAGSRVSVAVTGSGSDNLRFWSREAATTNRPVLTFTYTS